MDYLTTDATHGYLPDMVHPALTVPDRADAVCLADALDAAAASAQGMTFSNGRGQLLQSLSYAELRNEARSLARHLAGLGLARGERVGIVAEMNADFVTAFFACQYAGLLAVPLPVITGLGGRQGYEEQLSRVIETSHARIALGPQTALASLEAAAEGGKLLLIGTLDDLRRSPRFEGQLDPLGSGEASHIQFSSGSTQFPKGILIGQDAVMVNTRAIAEAIGFCAQDRVISWLPFYHDMGLIGCMLSPVVSHAPVDYLHTDDFAKRPLQWLKMISDKRGTITFAPTFGYDICTQRMRGNDIALDLSCLRIAGIGGEMVQPETLARFVETFEPFGFDKHALMPCYGMAEITLAHSFTPMGRGLRVDHVEKKSLLENIAKAAPANCVTRAFSSCGLPLPNHRIEIRDEAGNRLPERHIGRLFITGPSLMDGYDANPEANAEAFDGNGWLDTGDMGYLADGELYVTGRRKDMILVNGRNIWPQDLEWHTEQQIEGLRRRDTAAFAHEDGEGRETPVILISCRLPSETARQELRNKVHALLLRLHGIHCEVVLIPPRSLPFTTSGKLSRARAKQAWLAGEYTLSA